VAGVRRIAEGVANHYRQFSYPGTRDFDRNHENQIREVTLMFHEILLAFIPLFVAVDAIGLLPLYIGITHGLSGEVKRQIILRSMITALVLAIAFIVFGRAVFSFLGITMGDFMVAGGFILFAIAILDIINPAKERRAPVPADVGAVPLGTPLIAGPAVLTTSLMLLGRYGILSTVLAVALNIILAGIIFSSAGVLIRLIGTNGSRALAKVMALVLAAFAVMMIRQGVMSFLV
jgi:multiple antibiotic resistance protein